MREISSWSKLTLNQSFSTILTLCPILWLIFYWEFIIRPTTIYGGKKKIEHKKFTFYAELELACLAIKSRIDRKQTYTQSNIKIISFKIVLFVVILVEKPDSHILRIITKIFSCMTS